MSALEADPTLERFLGRFPQLRSSVERVVTSAAAVRAARSSALPPTVPWAGGPELERARRVFIAGIESLERLAAGETTEPDAILAATDAALSGALEMRVHRHAFSPRRTTTSPAARAALFAALDDFGAVFAHLETEALAAGVRRLPWQLELAPQAAPGTPMSALAITAHELPRTPASELSWGERCCLSGESWLTDSHAAPALRYRSLDSCGVSLAPGLYHGCTRLRAVLERLRPTCPEAIERLARPLPFLFDDFSPETSSPTFTRLGLYDYPSLAVTLNNLLQTHAHRPLFGTRGGAPSPLEPLRADRFAALGVEDRRMVALAGARSGFSWETYAEIRTLSLRLAHGLERFGLKAGERLGIVATQNCRELYLADFAAIFADLVSIVLPAGWRVEEMGAVLAQAEVRVVVADAGSARRLAAPELRRQCPALELLLVWGGSPPEPPAALPRIEALEPWLAVPPPAGWISASGIALTTAALWGDRVGERRARDEGIHADRDDDLYTILWTSGSTAAPRGTRVTRRRWAEEMRYEVEVWPHVSVSFQPSALAADRAGIWRTLAGGGRVGFARPGAALWEDLQAIRPTIFDAPPVVWNSLDNDYRQALSRPDATLAELAAVRDRLRRAMGGRLAVIGVGGAPSDPQMRQTIEEVFGIRLRTSYGTTETGTLAIEDQLIPGLDYRLVDAPELGFTARDQPFPRGELAVKTPRMSVGYFASAAGGFTPDGYFLTGDVVEVGPGRQLTLLGRRKNFLKLSGGEFVAPETLERCYRSSERVEAIFVTASPLESQVVAVVIPARDDLSAREALAELRALAHREGLRPCEIPAAVVIEPRRGRSLAWTPENGLLTASLKLDRRALEAKYRDRIAEAYAETRGVRERMGDLIGSDLGVEGFEHRLVQIAAALLGQPMAEIDPRRSLTELGAGSLVAMDFGLRLGQVFPTSRATRAEGETMAGLAELPLEELAAELARQKSSTSVVRVRAAPAPLKAVARDEAPAEIANQDAATPLLLTDPLPAQSSSPHVLLTGANGFLGLHLLFQLAVELPPEARIYALVRAGDAGAARGRLEQALRRAALTLPPQRQVIVLAGDLARARLGLDPAGWERLANEVGLIYHAAAQVSSNADYARLRAANVLGTRRVLELALTATLKSCHFISSLSVVPLLRRASGRRVDETTPLPERLAPSLLRTSAGYAISKWVAERWVQRAHEQTRGALRVSISRPALLVWSSLTGCANPEDWFGRVLASCLLLRSTPGPEEVGVVRWVPETPVSVRGIDLVPVDFAARAIARLGALTHQNALPAAPEFAIGRAPTFHVSNLAAAEKGFVTWDRLMDLLVLTDYRHGRSRPPLASEPLARWAASVELTGAPATAELSALRKMKAIFEPTEASRFREAMMLAGDESPGCPPVDETLLRTFLDRAEAGAGGGT